MGVVHLNWGGPCLWVVTEAVGRLAEAGWRWSFLLPCGVGCVCFYVDVMLCGCCCCAYLLLHGSASGTISGAMALFGVVCCCAVPRRAVFQQEL